MLENKNWSTATLFDETKNDILSRNGKLFELPTLSDIDTIADIQSHLQLQNL